MQGYRALPVATVDGLAEPDEATILEHARRGGFPADNVARIVRMIDPVTAEHDFAERSPQAPDRST